MDSTLGKGEVGSSILPRGTISLPHIFYCFRLHGRDGRIWLRRRFVTILEERFRNRVKQTGETRAICSLGVRGAVL